MAHYVTDEDINLIKVAGNYSPKQREAFLMAHPIGSYFITEENINPIDEYGGGWLKLDEGYTLWTVSSGAGDKISAGLPDITGTFGETVYVLSNITSGAFKQTKVYGNKVTLGSWAEVADMEFKASYSNNIYGQSTTVQPPAYKVYIWKRIS